MFGRVNFLQKSGAARLDFEYRASEIETESLTHQAGLKFPELSHIHNRGQASLAIAGLKLTTFVL